MVNSSITSRPQLVYLVFGADTYHQEAVFSICSALAALRDTPAHNLDIQVFTDNPDPYRELPVRLRPFDQATRQAWAEPHGYHFRIKHVALLEVLKESELALLIDTDTFFHQSPLALFRRIEPGTLLCNTIGMRYGETRESVLYTALSEELFERGLTDDQMSQLNSGVIGLHRSDWPLLERSIALMDDLYPRAQQAYILEEFCLALAAYNRYEVRECPDLIHHYWSRKQLFRAKTQAWLVKHRHALLSKAALDDTLKVTAYLPRPPAPQRLLFKAVTLTLPKLQRQFMRELLYGCYRHTNEFDQACAPVWWEKAQENVERKMKKPLRPQQLERWLRHPGIRLLLGQRRESIYQHLMGRQKS